MTDTNLNVSGISSLSSSVVVAEDEPSDSGSAAAQWKTNKDSNDEELEKRVKYLEGILEALTMELRNEVKVELREAKAELKEVKTERDEAKAELKEVKTERDVVKAELDKAKTEREEMESDVILVCNGFSNELISTKTEHLIELKLLNSKLTALQEAYEKLKAKLDEPLDYNIKSLDVKLMGVMQLEVDLEEARRERDEARFEVGRRDGDINILNAKLAEKEALPEKPAFKHFRSHVVNAKLEALLKKSELEDVQLASFRDLNVFLLDQPTKASYDAALLDWKNFDLVQREELLDEAQREYNEVVRLGIKDHLNIRASELRRHPPVVSSMNTLVFGPAKELSAADLKRLEKQRAAALEEFRSSKGVVPEDLGDHFGSEFPCLNMET
ncbi:hypothetical protein MPSEU_000151400 [Mayamaea pseudoterrestris]|nr:hypothetical protein MPSEU_000151400 [Mayamaea pseudoterrestris]